MFVDASSNNESQKHYSRQKKTDTSLYILYDSIYLKLKEIGAPGWRSRLSVRLQPGHDLGVCEFEPRVRLWADGSEPGACFRFCVSLSLSAPPPFMLCLSLSQK